MLKLGELKLRHNSVRPPQLSRRVQIKCHRIHMVSIESLGEESKAGSDFLSLQFTRFSYFHTLSPIHSLLLHLKFIRMCVHFYFEKVVL